MDRLEIKAIKSSLGYWTKGGRKINPRGIRAHESGLIEILYKAEFAQSKRDKIKISHALREAPIFYNYKDHLLKLQPIGSSMLRKTKKSNIDYSVRYVRTNLI